MRLKTCFGCFSLRTGTVAIGSVTVVWTILSAISAFSVMDELTDNSQDLLLQFIIKTFFTGVLIHVVVIGAMAALMIYGAQNKKPACVFPWLALSTTDLLVWSSISLGATITTPMMLPIKWFFLLLVLASVCLSIHFYVWFVVYSFYKQMFDEKYYIVIPLIEVEKLDQLKTGYHDV